LLNKIKRALREIRKRWSHGRAASLSSNIQGGCAKSPHKKYRKLRDPATGIYKGAVEFNVCLSPPAPNERTGGQNEIKPRSRTMPQIHRHRILFAFIRCSINSAATSLRSSRRESRRRPVPSVASGGVGLRQTVSCGGSGPGEVFHRVRETRPERHGQAALSGSKTKAPGSAGGYLLST
jgi:hypothetical protein